MYIITPHPHLSLSLSLTLLPEHRIIKSILIVSLELVQKVLRSSFAKLVIFMKEIAYAAFDLPGASKQYVFSFELAHCIFPYNSYFVWWIALRGC